MRLNLKLVPDILKSYGKSVNSVIRQGNPITYVVTHPELYQWIQMYSNEAVKFGQGPRTLRYFSGRPDRRGDTRDCDLKNQAGNFAVTPGPELASGDTPKVGTSRWRRYIFFRCRVV